MTTAGVPGLGFTPFEVRPDVIVETGRQADRLGFGSVSVAEAMTLAAPVVLTQLALATERVELATGVMSVWSRTPGTLAMTAADLQDLSGGRFSLGLGASTAPLTEGFHGIAWQHPVGKVRDVLVAVRTLLAGGRLPGAPDGARPLRLLRPPAAPVPLGLAAITPASVRLAGALADRWLPFLWPVNRLEEGGELLEAGAVAGGRHERALVTACVPVATAPDEAGAAAVAARWLLTYCTSMGPVYPRVLREFGYSREVDAVLTANAEAARPVLPSAAERLARDVLLFASHDDVAEAYQAWRGASDVVSLVLPFGVDRGTLGETVEALAPERLGLKASSRPVEDAGLRST
jgi:alkanesulfonate monooxygenase SsuD/methylene tetrahydromethanopterin reductase-like flavin-dependent oxidoreductase (luciferase family)